MKRKRYPIPEFDGDFVNIYCPAGDVYNGIDTTGFRNSQYYEDWITNDFSVLKEGDLWHIVGITHPRPQGFVDGFDYNPSNIHEAEYQLFHCVAKGENFGDVFCKNSFADMDKILYPPQRPGEKPELWAPHLMKYEGKYNVIYSPQEMRRVVSCDFESWEQAPVLFRCTDPAARDPFIYEEDGKFYCLYIEDRYLKYRVSDNMADWSEEKILQEQFFANCHTESPFMLKRAGVYYLFWTIYDGRNGCYDNRTMVFAGESFEELYSSAPVTMLRAHAPEIVMDPNGDSYLLSVFYPNNGISAVKLKWV